MTFPNSDICDNQQPPTMREHLSYEDKHKDHHGQYRHLPVSRGQSSQLLPKLPHSPGLDDIHRVEPHASLRSSRYPVIPPLTPPGQRPQQYFGPHFLHTSHDPLLDDPYGISLGHVKPKQQPTRHPSFDDGLESFRFSEAHNPAYNLLDTGYALHPSHRRQADSQSLELFTRDVAITILDEIIAEMARGVAQEMSTKAQQRLWEVYSERSRYYHPCLTNIEDDVMNEELRDIIKEVVHEMVTDHFKSKTTMNHQNTEKKNVTDLIKESVSEISSEVCGSDLSNKVYNDSLSSLVSDVVQEVLTESKTTTVSSIETSQLTINLLIDGFQLDHLLMKLANHRQIWNDSQIKDMLLDNLLASEFIHLFDLGSTEGQRSCNVVSLKRFHENTTSNYSLHFLLDKLSETLDEDLEDLLEYEYTQEIISTKLNTEIS